MTHTNTQHTRTGAAASPDPADDVGRPMPLATFDVASAFLAGLSPATQRCYAGDVARFARWLDERRAAAGRPGSAPLTAQTAAHVLLSQGRGFAHRLVTEWRAEMMSEGLSASTINRRLAALRALTKTARLSELIEWTLEVPSLKKEPRRDMRGPGAEAVASMLEQTDSARDRAILRCLHDVGLRRSEVSGLELGHYDVAAGVLMVRGKGKRERVRVALPPPTRRALALWLGERGLKPGALFLNKFGDGITDKVVYRVVVEAGKRAGVGHVRPHGLRHTAVTTVLQKTNGNVAAAQSFARHCDPRVTMGYADDTEEQAAAAARLIALDPTDT